ncbi:MHYT domain-containing protein [Flavobacterium sp. W21_SRS_FM6]|uniref:MHYT domain-containing protein n=1 Tax=Flavobacterium sp. W21_SRS_FM6 TaxID=3240268 RepID=UPI003F90D81F
MSDIFTALFDYPQDNLLVFGNFDPTLVVLSFAIAIFASFMGFQVASYASHSRTEFGRQLSLMTGSVALGGGVWSMHFIGMLAFELCTVVEYNWRITALSMLPALVASWVAMSLITRSSIDFKRLLLGGLLVGAGIGTMHYVGMAAMNMSLLLRYDLSTFFISIIVAVILAMLALWIRFGLEAVMQYRLTTMSKTLIASIVMGMAITGMHYTGMAAARFVRPPGFEFSEQSSEMSIFLAIGVTLITIIITSLVLAANLAMRYKETSIKARYNERRLLATMDTAHDSIVTIDERGIITSINKAVERLLGWRSAQLLGSNVRMIMPQLMSDEQTHSVQGYLSRFEEHDSQGAGQECNVLHKNGELIPVRIAVGHVETEHENLYVAFISDLRQRNKMEADLRDNEAKFRSLIANIPGIAYRCLIDKTWPMEFVSDEIEHVTGYPAEDFLLPNPKRSFADFYHPQDLPTIMSSDASEEQGFQLEYRIIDKNGNEKWLLEFGRKVSSPDKKQVWLDGFIMDISQRKEMEVQLIEAKEIAEAAAASRAAFLANMSHEIRTPMNAVIGFSDILLDSALTLEQKKYLNTINQSAKSLMHLLNDVLDSAKLDKGKIELEYRDFSLVEEIDAVVSTLWLQAKNKGLDIELRFAENLGHFYHGAPDRLRQVLTNLLGNAIKFTEKGQILVAINLLAAQEKGREQQIEFVIQDSGIGMTPEQVANVFEAFSQADATMSRRFGGTGLGTTISKQLVELMGGSIDVVSELNQGSTFSFILPLQPIDIFKEKSTQVMHELPPLNLLIVDDIEQNLDLLTVLLKRAGHQVQTARDGEQALLRMQASRFDVVLMDVQMPVLDGLSATEKRREYELENALAALPIIALTASVLPEDKKAAFDAGMNGFANKPVNMDILNAEIARVLNITEFSDTQQTIIKKPSLVIDENMGVMLWGSAELLFAEIKKFLHKQHEVLEKYQLALNSLDWTELKYLAHSMKGSAGNLALTYLLEIVTEFEISIHNQNEFVAKRLINEIKEHLEQIWQKLQELDQAYSEPSSQDVRYNAAEFLRLAKAIHKMVAQNEFDEPLFAKLQQAAPQKYEQEVTAVFQALNDFDFEHALTGCNTLVARLEEE